MTEFAAERNPELETIVLELAESRQRIDTFLEYSFHSDFLQQPQTFSFTMAGASLDASLKAQIKIGAKVALYVDNNLQATGYIDNVSHRYDRSGGYILTLEGRDALGYAIHGHIDDRIQFSSQMTLLQLLQAVFRPFGFKEYLSDVDANRNVLTGAIHGIGRTKKGRPIKSAKLHECQPKFGEGAYAFAARVAQRFGFHIWASADGGTIIVGEPEYEQDPLYQIHHRIDDGGFRNNVLDGTITYDGTQPAILYCWGEAGDVPFRKSHTSCGIYNPFVTSPDFTDIKKRRPEVTKFLNEIRPDAIVTPFARPMYLHDDDAHTQEQLEAYAKREMSLYTRKSLVCQYSVAGHTSNRHPWTVDTIVEVDDEYGSVHEPMWIQERTFTKSRSSGTRTSLTLIRKETLKF